MMKHTSENLIKYKRIFFKIILLFLFTNLINSMKSMNNLPLEIIEEIGLKIIKEKNINIENKIKNLKALLLSKKEYSKFLYCAKFNEKIFQILRQQENIINSFELTYKINTPGVIEYFSNYLDSNLAPKIFYSIFQETITKEDFKFIKFLINLSTINKDLLFYNVDLDELEPIYYNRDTILELLFYKAINTNNHNLKVELNESISHIIKNNKELGLYLIQNSKKNRKSYNIITLCLENYNIELAKIIIKNTSNYIPTKSLLYSGQPCQDPLLYCIKTNSVDFFQFLIECGWAITYQALNEARSNKQMLNNLESYLKKI